MQFTSIGRLGKTFGLDGDLRLNVDALYQDVLDEYSRNNNAVFVLIDGFKIPFFIKSINWDKMLIRFERIKNDEQLQELVGADLFIESHDAIESPIPDLDQLIGFNIYNIEDEKVIGRIIRIEDNPAHPIAIVELNDAEVMVPMVADWIRDIYPEQRQIKMELPDGLIES